MEDSLEPHNKSLSPTPLLPPGFRFHPSPQQIFTYYLHHKNTTNDNPADPSIPLAFSLIPDIDLSNYHPSHLPQATRFPSRRAGLKNHCYFFTRNAGDCATRKGKGGEWRRKDMGREVVGEGDGAAVLGMVTTFLFFSRDSSSSNRLNMTDWVLIEYALVDHREDSFVFCRIFFEPQFGNNAEEQVQDCCAKDTINVTHNTTKDDFTDTVNNSQSPLKLTGKPDNKIVNAPMEFDRFKLPRTAHQPTRQDQQSDGPERGGIKLDVAVAEKVSTDSQIPEDDFIELNDLISPLPDHDSSG